MADISDLGEGDEIEAVIRLTVVKGTDPNRFWDKLVVADKDGAVLTGLTPLVEIAERISLVLPEIVPGRPYVDAEGKLYVGRSKGRVIHFDGNTPRWYSDPRSDHHASGLSEHRPLPAGLRPAKVVPAP